MQQQALPQVIQAFILKKHGNKTVKVDTTPYWSTVRFQFTAAGVLAAGVQRQAFAYAIGEDRVRAGFTGAAGAANAATMADTNLLSGGMTRLNADIFIGGVAAYFTPDSEVALIKRVVRECAVTMTTDGQNTSPLACLEHLPSGGGLQGVGNSVLKLPAENQSGGVNNGGGTPIGFVNNGNAMAGNFFELNSPVLWTGQQGSDSNFRLNFNVDRPITEAPGAARAAAAGIGAFTPPAAIGDPGTYVDVRVRLANWAISLPSING
ncbi:MAG: hypothetical protein WKG32_20935 [Gemmatimonadaceae bacterium]